MPPVPLPDGVFRAGDNNLGEDNINLTINTVGGDNVVITLSAADNISWWKGVCKGQWEMLSTQDDRRGPSSGRFPKGDLDGAALFKAKAFGVHTAMYDLKVEGGFVTGHEYHFRWTRDS